MHVEPFNEVSLFHVGTTVDSSGGRKENKSAVARSDAESWEWLWDVVGFPFRTWRTLLIYVRGGDGQGRPY